MKISRIHIENYRSIKELDFYPNNYCVLIGENNAGKSNILKAINLVLGETWPTDRTFTQDDFHMHDLERDIVIQVYFNEPIKTWKNKSIEVNGLELRCKAYKRAYKGLPKGTLSVDFNCINAKGEAIKYPSEPLQAGKQAKDWYALRVSKEIKENIPFIYVDVFRDYQRQDPSNRWSVLRKLLNDINTKIANSKDMVDVLTANGEVKMTRKQAFEYKINEAYGYLKTADFIGLEEKIRNNTLEQMGISREHGDVSIRFDTYDPMNVFRNLQLFVDQMGISSSADMVGAGLQSAIVIAIFRTYEEIKKEGAIFAIEEPEVFLHPQIERYFSDVLNSISNNNQVFITTHSPVFIRIYQPEEVCLIRRNGTNGTTATICTRKQIAEPVKKELKLQNYFDTQRSEMFFAKGLILVEGATEKISMPVVSSLLGLNLNQHGISVIECGGKGNLLLFAQIADAFRIPYVVVADHDIVFEEGVPDPNKLLRIKEANKNHETKNKALSEGIEPGHLFWLYPDFEAEIGVSGNSDNKLKNALDYFNSLQADKIPESLVRPIKKIIELISER